MTFVYSMDGHNIVHNEWPTQECVTRYVYVNNVTRKDLVIHWD